MRVFLFLLATICSNSYAEIDATFGSGLGKQVWTGVQPNDKPTSRVNINVYIDATSSTNGINAAIGFDFKCPGDENPTRSTGEDATSGQNIYLGFPLITALYYESWKTNIVDTRSCYMNWSASAIGSTTSSGTTIGFELNGVYGTFILNFTDATTSPQYRRARSSSSIFTMYKEPTCH